MCCCNKRLQTTSPTNSLSGLHQHIGRYQYKEAASAHNPANSDMQSGGPCTTKRRW